MSNIEAMTGLVNINMFVASIPPEQGEHNQFVNTKFTRPVMEICKSSLKARTFDFFKEQMGREPKAKGTLKMM